MNISLNDLAKILDGVVIGDGSIMVSTLAPIDEITKGSLVWAEGLDKMSLAEKSEAAALLVNQEKKSSNKALIQVAHPLKAFIHLLEVFHPSPKKEAQIHPTAIIAKDVILGENVSIGPYVTIEEGTQIGDNCQIKAQVCIGSQVSIGQDSVIYPQVCIYAGTKIGKRVRIHASSVIGSDGFGYSFIDGQHLKIPHKGSVLIEDDVEIGASSIIDRATLGQTVIGAGTKIDNLVQIAHSVKLGQHNILCAFTGVAGSSQSGDRVIFAANVGVSDHVRIDSDVILAARAGVPPKKHLIRGHVYLGNPARPKEKALEQEFALTRIPFMRKNLKNLSGKLETLSQELAELKDKKSQTEPVE